MHARNTQIRGGGKGKLASPFIGRPDLFILPLSASLMALQPSPSLAHTMLSKVSIP